MRKTCSSDQEKLLKFEAEGRESAKILRSLEQFIQTVKCQVLVTECFFNLFLETIRFQIGKHYWDLETCRKSLKNKVLLVLLFMKF